MADTKSIRVYESDFDRMESLASEGSIPAMFKEVVTKAEEHDK